MRPPRSHPRAYAHDDVYKRRLYDLVRPFLRQKRRRRSSFNSSNEKKTYFISGTSLMVHYGIGAPALGHLRVEPEGFDHWLYPSWTGGGRPPLWGGVATPRLQFIWMLTRRVKIRNFTYCSTLNLIFSIYFYHRVCTPMLPVNLQVSQGYPYTQLFKIVTWLTRIPVIGRGRGRRPRPPKVSRKFFIWVKASSEGDIFISYIWSKIFYLSRIYESKDLK